MGKQDIVLRDVFERMAYDMAVEYLERNEIAKPYELFYTDFVQCYIQGARWRETAFLSFIRFTRTAVARLREQNPHLPKEFIQLERMMDEVEGISRET